MDGFLSMSASLPSLELAGDQVCILDLMRVVTGTPGKSQLTSLENAHVRSNSFPQS